MEEERKLEEAYDEKLREEREKREIEESEQAPDETIPAREAAKEAVIEKRHAMWEGRAKRAQDRAEKLFDRLRVGLDGQLLMLVHIYALLFMFSRPHCYRKDLFSDYNQSSSNCKSVQPVPAWVEEPVSPVRHSSSGGATNNPLKQSTFSQYALGKVDSQNRHTYTSV